MKKTVILRTCKDDLLCGLQNMEPNIGNTYVSQVTRVRTFLHVLEEINQLCLWDVLS